ncbi:erythrocyte membrane protein 1, PfEMP1 [Plasmodium sp. DRC-Itaito]|nr:erythrocyte membrane protein 1, PfEMP1 [Plasmodium sp. DRC-Itaito]
MAAQKTPSVDEYNKATSAKELLDLIGEAVHKQVGKEESEYRKYLHGSLSKVKFSNGDIIDNDDPCKLNYRYHTTVTNSEIDPCDKRLADRFSDEGGGECATSKIKGNNEGIGGACAPYRRLHLCDRNLEQIQPHQVKNTDKLLVDVCMAAKFEGDSISGEHSKHRATHTESHSQLCTELARSFADIGDIIRGRDLYLGRKKKKEGETEREKLENKLKEIFKEIYDKLIDDIKDNGAKKKKAEQRYNRPAEYFKLREDWWEANRETVWKAITCGAGSHAYFRRTCAGGASPTTGQCRCAISDVPTYFDYVPQYLRWFEEWAEDFCRKKKQKVENAIKKCRNKYEEKERYCSLNGFDCTQTVRARGKLRYGNRCIDCLYACNPYHEWIDNQRKQFDKQKKKYQTEIGKYGNAASGTGRSKRNIRSNNKYEGYEKKFYEEITKSERRSVGAFLDLLSAENECTNIKDDKEGKINFKEVKDGDNNDNEGTFYRSEYCQPCPLCGVERNGMSWREKKGGQCTRGKFYEITTGAESTDIDVLSFGDKPKGIKKKMDTFCDKNDSDKENKELYESWKCYKDEDVKKDVEDEDEDENEFNAGGVCIWKNEKEKVSEDDAQEFQKTFNDFFYFWIRRFLNDSIEWRNEHGKCINNKNTCTNKCHGKCKCFLKWVEQKRKEWNKIVNHFKAQGDLAGAPYYITLEYILKKDELLEFIEDIYGNTEETEHIKEMLRQEGRKNEGQEKTGAGAVVTENNTTIDKLLGKEKKDAEDCIQKQEECNKQRGDDGDPRRSLPSTPTGPRGQPRSEDHQDIPRNPTSDYEEDEEEDDDEEEEKAEDESKTSESKEGTTGVEGPKGDAGPRTPTVENVCDIVKDALSGSLKDACAQKYNYPHRYYGWKCVTPTTTTTQSGEATRRDRRSPRDTQSVSSATGAASGEKSGASCVPPRRRKLYVTPLIKLGDTISAPHGVPTPLGGEPTRGLQASDLRDAFVKSAAVETFFLWDRYKKEKKPPATEGSPLLANSLASKSLFGNISSSDDENQDPQQQLARGEIPPDFLRQMFYTLGDYRDILVGIDSGDVKEALKKSVVKTEASGTETDKVVQSGDDTWDTIQNAINKHIPSGTESSSKPPKPDSSSGTSRSTLWEEYRESIWNGMVCALTYKENGTEGNTTITQDPKLKEALLEEKTNKPKSDAGGTNNYTYGGVTIGGNDGTSAFTPGETKLDAGKGTPLTEFIKRPPFFRWLEEWGVNFCKKRKEMLKEVRHNCRDILYAGHEYCGGDGYDCKYEELDHHKKLADLNCPDCGKYCTFYRRWIKKKFQQFNEQKGKYGDELEKLKLNTDNAVYEKYYKELEKKKHCTVDKFLTSLKHCKDDDGSDDENDDDKKNNKIDFKNPEKTFNPSTYCKACPVYGVQQQGVKYIPLDKPHHRTRKGLSGESEPDRHPTNIKLLMLNRKGTNMDNVQELPVLQEACRNTELLNDFILQSWTCQNSNGVDQCNLTIPNAPTDYDDNNIWFNVFFQRWLRYFVRDYNKLKHKIDPCIKKKRDGDQSHNCITGCNGKCSCVEQWLEIKKQEWLKIKSHYDKHSKDVNHGIPHSVKGYFDLLLFDNDIQKIRGNHNSFNDVESKVCKCAKSSEKDDGHEVDIIDCLLHNLRKKTENCKNDHPPDKPCPPTSQTPTLEDDEDDYPSLEVLGGEQNTEEAKKKMIPTFCDIDETTQSTVDEDIICEKPESPPVEPEHGEPRPPETEPETENENPIHHQSEGNPEQTPILKPEEEAPGPEINGKGTEDTLAPNQGKKVDQKKREPPRKVASETPLLRQPHVQLALSSSTLAWCIGIGITGLSYWALMKRKPKPPVKLFSVLDIPKGDFDMPNLTSKNRYIPYGTGKHRGKRYIYIEGDTDDEKYIGDITSSDITSSSESEYEETDTYVRHVPPKYKTLIEVVLEPSKRDTLSGDIPGDIQNDIPTSDINSGDHTPSDDINSGNNIPSDDAPSNKLTDDEWNELKDEFISQYLENTEPNNNISGTIRINTQPNILRDNVDQKPFIMSIHDRNLYTGEEYNYDMINSGIYPSSSNRDSYSDKNGSYSDNRYSLSDKNVSYSGIDLINDSLSGDYIDIYDEILKRKENELFGTENTKHTCIHSVAKHTNTDPILNQINLFHEWLDRHRNMSEKWDNTVDILHKLKEGWENETHSGNKHSDIPIRKLSDTPSGKNVVNSDVSIQIDMDDPKPTNEDNVVDINPHKYTVDSNPNQTFRSSTNPVENNTYVNTPTNVQIEMSVKNREMMKEKYPISDMWDI